MCNYSWLPILTFLILFNIYHFLCILITLSLIILYWGLYSTTYDFLRPPSTHITHPKEVWKTPCSHCWMVCMNILKKPVLLLRIVFVDFSSAFNTIQPHLLVKKLLDMDVNSRIILWINSFLTQGEQQVRINFTVSPRLVTNTRAPQGCVLSPLLYTIYTNDCVAMSPNKTMIKYADDTCIVGLCIQIMTHCRVSTKKSLSLLSGGNKTIGKLMWTKLKNSLLIIDRTKHLYRPLQ